MQVVVALWHEPDTHVCPICVPFVQLLLPHAVPSRPATQFMPVLSTTRQGMDAQFRPEVAHSLPVAAVWQFMLAQSVLLLHDWPIFFLQPVPATHVSVAVLHPEPPLHRQLLDMHVSPAPVAVHEVPQPPQLAGSLVVSRQVPPQH